MKRLPLISLLAGFGASITATAAPSALLPIAQLTRTTPVDFEQEIMHFMRDNCVSCHCKTTSKGGLNLETPELILKGGDTGPGLKAGNGSESLLFQAAAHLDEDLKMPPRDNKAKAAIEAAEKAKKKSDDDLQAPRTAATAAEKPIRALAFSLNGQTLATSGDDTLIHTWSAESGEAIEIFKSAKTPLASLAFTPGGQLLSASQDHTVTVRDITPAWKFDRAIGSSDGKSPLADRVQSLAFSPDGRFLAIGGGEPSRGGEIKMWDTRSGNFARDLPNIHSDSVLALEFSPDGKFLASGTADKIARVTDLGTGKVTKSFEGHTHHVLGLSWSLDGRTLATSGADNVVKIWDFTTGDRKKNIEGYDKEVTSVHFAGATDQLVTSSGDNKVRIVSADGKEIRVLPEVVEFVQSAATTADGKLVVAGGQDSILSVWKAADGTAVLKFSP